MIRRLAYWVLVMQALALICSQSSNAQKLEQVIADAKKEGEVTLVASASTWRANTPS